MKVERWEVNAILALSLLQGYKLNPGEEPFAVTVDDQWRETVWLKKLVTEWKDD